MCVNSSSLPESAEAAGETSVPFKADAPLRLGARLVSYCRRFSEPKHPLSQILTGMTKKSRLATNPQAS